MDSPKELRSEEFSERLVPIFDYVWQQEAGLPFNPSHFFPTWRRYMEAGIARTWEIDGAVLGALFARHIYSGEYEALVQFWFALPAVRGTGAPGTLFRAFERAAKRAGCVTIHSASHHKLSPLRRQYGYTAHGFENTETLFSKKL